MFLLSINSFAQKITFQYDIAGNQISRSYCLSCRQSNLPIKEFKDLETSDLQKFFPDDVISFYPNPVKDELYLEWELINENKVLNIQVYNINGQLLKNIDEFSNNKTVISFQEFTTGTYIIILNYATGNQKSIKIIKN